MKCTEAHELIGELLEETISEDDRRALDKHLESCPECRDLLEDFREIKVRAAALPKLEPSPTVWTNVLEDVRRRTESVRSVPAMNWWDRLFAPGRPRYVLASALALCVIVGGAVLIRSPRKSAAPAVGGDVYTMAKLREAETYYQLAIKALAEAAAAQKTGLDAKTTDALEADLRTIDTVIASCKDAVRRDPGSVEARVYLLGAYKGKVDFLENILTAKKKSVDPSAAEIIL